MFKELQGKKSYILAFIAILSAWGAYFAQTTDLQTAITATFAALATITIRAGIATENKKAVEAMKVASAPESEEVTKAKALLKSKGINSLGLCLILFFGLSLTACQTGIGRAGALAFKGVPAEIPQALDAIEAEYDLRANYEMRDIVNSAPVTPDGILRQESAKAALQARIDAEHSLIDSVRTYIGVEKAVDPKATIDAAAKRRTELLDATLVRLTKK